MLLYPNRPNQCQTTGEISLDGLTIETGTVLSMIWSVGNRGPGYFPSPRNSTRVEVRRGASCSVWGSVPVSDMRHRPRHAAAPCQAHGRAKSRV